MCDAIIAASEIALKKSEESLMKCDSAKDPQDCRYKMRVEIRHWQNKIHEQKRKLARLQINSQPYPNTNTKSKPVAIPVAPPTDPFMEEKPKATPVKKQQPVVANTPNKTTSDPFGDTITDLDDFKQTTSNPFG
jgi:hypothetical protein